MWVTAILAAGGRGARMGAQLPKQLLPIGNRTILQRSFDTLEQMGAIAEIVVALPTDLAARPPDFLKSSRKPIHVVDGGARRQDSVVNAFQKIEVGRTDRVLIHDAARPFATPTLFHRVIEESKQHVAVTAGLRPTDTVKQVRERRLDESLPVVADTLPRERLYLIQTPQIFSTTCLAEAINLGRGDKDATDEATLLERAGFPVVIVEGEPTNIKITTEQDLRIAEAMVADTAPSLRSEPPLPRIGVGYDLHRLEPGRKLILGGVEIDHETGLIGHSDADVLCHAVTDALLGAAAAGDIGRHFPDTDPAWKDADSVQLLSRAAGVIREAGFMIVNVDAVVIAELPKLAPHVDRIRTRLARALGIDMAAVSVKGKTNEKVGALGRNEAIAVHAVALLVGRPTVSLSRER
jgi:2-C-methyl-D-erythritol 4-phosphate cytidylyltransferase/2-C-methyl-D-erythritol 2,4-cyclodiphosphate synthase